MKRNAEFTVIGAALACGATLSPSTQAGGLSLYEIATPDVGLASAGYAARAQDASTVFKNPAGMSLLQGSQFQAGAQLAYANVGFSPDANTSPLLGAGSGGNAIGALPGASLFFTHQLSDRFAVGFGSLSYFGSMEKFDDGWVGRYYGRYYVQKGALLGMSLMPAASFKATDWLSVGAGLNAMYGYLDSQTAVRTGLASPDGQMEMNDHTWGFGANVGVLVEPRKGTRIGVTYLSPVKLDFNPTPSFSGLGAFAAAKPIFTSPPQLDMGLTVPQSVMLSAYQELNAKWALLANVGWQNWKQFGEPQVGVNSATPTSLTANLNYQDTWHGALGAQYRASDQWKFIGGVAYDCSAVSDADRTLAAPVGEAYRFGLGAQWQVSKAVSLGAAYEFLWAGNMPVVQGDAAAYRGRVSGGFNDSWFSFLAVNVDWRF